MGTQVTGRKRIPNREKLTAEDDALSQIAREAEARLAAKRAARAEAREIRMKELERQQKEIYQAQKKYYGLDSKWGHIEQWMEDSERYSRHSRRHASISDDEERMSVGSRGSLRGNYSDLCSSTGSLPSSRLQNGRPSDYSGFLGSSSRASSRASSARASPVVEERSDFLEKGSRTASTLSAATLASLGGGLSRRGSCDTSISADTEASIREIKDSLAEVEEKYRKAMVSNAQLDNEKSNLMYQVDTLRDTLMELEELLYETRRESEEKTREYERERHAHSILQFQFNEMKETLKQSEELLTDARHLRMKQESYVREISDLQETLEWKEKKIGALERQKEYSDITQDERDALRDEVFRLRDALKKHGIILGSEVTTNGETGGNRIDGPENEESASRLAQDPHTPIMSGDSMLERSPDGRGSEVDSTSWKNVRPSIGYKSHSLIPRRRIRVETAANQEEPKKSLSEYGFGKPMAIQSSNDKSAMQEICHAAEIGQLVEAEHVEQAFTQSMEYHEKEGAYQQSVSVDSHAGTITHIMMEESLSGDETEAGNQMEETTSLLNEDVKNAFAEHLKNYQVIATQGHFATIHEREQDHMETEWGMEMPGTSKSCQDLISPLILDDVTISSSSLEVHSWNSEEEESEMEPELQFEDIQGCTLSMPVEEKGIAMFLDSCSEAGALDFEVLALDQSYMPGSEHQKDTAAAEKQTNSRARLRSKRRHECSVS
ncbi:uncharacterized protein lrrfip1b isoform X2 [Salminus brasiliensis]|uniref:uncharacterized protein lrrfip1b isoform X2 n=1 Tax=Salminus brasiliensis TaxID=930266 RepID=UPI003B8307EC